LKLVETTYKDVSNEFQSVETTYKDVSNEFQSVETTYKDVSWEYPEVETTYKDVSNEFQSVETTYMGVSWEYPEVETTYKDVSTLFGAGMRRPYRSSLQGGKMLDSQKFKGLYRIDSKRLKDYDYSQSGLYFVTICTNKHIPYFGYILNDKMVLSEAGNIVQQFWLAIPSHFGNVLLDEFIVMPNHMHGVIEINNVETTYKGVSNEFQSVETTYKDVSSIPEQVETRKLYVSTLGIMINQFKRICTIEMKRQMIDFQWQSRYYDHIIREYEDLDRIRQYITGNPKMWNNDELYKT
jgi:putative transposase